VEKMYASRLRARTGEILARDGNRLLLIEAQSILLLVIAAYVLATYAISLVLFMHHDAELIAGAVSIALAVIVPLLGGFFVLPLVFGLFYMAQRMIDGVPCTPADLFFAFRSRKSYSLAMWGTFDVFVIGMVLYLGVCSIGIWAPAILTDARILAALILLALLILAVASAPFYTRVYDALCPCVVVHPTPLCRARRALRLLVGHLPGILLGLLTVGVTLVADAIPRILISRLIDADDACTLAYDSILEDELYESSDDK